jgi:hypothetical protein
MKVVLLFVLWAGCYTEPQVVIRTKIERHTQRVIVPCIDKNNWPPPLPCQSNSPMWGDGCGDFENDKRFKPYDCTGLSSLECTDLARLAWADYGHAVEEWVRYYVWPQCTMAEEDRAFP